jgi:hypothetical protein
VIRFAINLLEKSKPHHFSGNASRISISFDPKRYKKEEATFADGFSYMHHNQL